MRIGKQDILILLLTFISLLGAWIVDILLPPRILVASLYTLPILIIASRFRAKATSLVMMIALIVFSAQAATESQDTLATLFQGLGILIAGALAILLNQQRFKAEKLKAESENTKKQLEIFIHIAAHDVMQPITTANLYAQMLSKTTKGKEHQSAKRLMSALNHVKYLISDLGDTARIGSGQFSLNLEKIDLSKLIKETAAESQITTSKHEIIVSTPTPLLGDCDRERLRRVLSNLLSNAIKYTPDGGKIEVLGKRSGTSFLISVTDHGIGMTRKECTTLFQPFVRQYKGEENIKGSGLGLYICRLIVEAHKGKIWVKSKKGKGSSFFVKLPL